MEGAQLNGGWGERFRDPVALGGRFVVLVSQVVYLLTLTISCPFWDSGEFIATSYVLGIPHPPGTPLYVLIGRLFTLFPFGEISARVNYLSAFAASLAALFTYLVTVKFVRRWTNRPVNRVDQLIAVGGGIVAAFFTAFGRTFWDNAIEAEVYSLSSFIMLLSVWLVLKWEESGPEGQRDNNLLLLIGYLLFVTIGIHMGTFLVAPPIFLYLLLVSRRTILHLNNLPLVPVILGVLLNALGAGLGISALVAGGGFLLVSIGQRGGQNRRSLAFWLVVLGFLGLTVQLFLIVRARLDPMINEADPNNWKDLWLVLSRDQYKPPNPFTHRKAEFVIQLTKHFWRYWQDQYHLGFRPASVAMYLPFGLGLVGLVAQGIKDRRRFFLQLMLVLITTLFLVFYLNFKENEVRDRDYFFVAGYHFFAIWIGLSAAAIAGWLRGDPKVEDGLVVEQSGGRLFGLGTALVLCVVACFPIAHGWFQHDRTDFYVARDYAYNMLQPLEENAIIFTNGDNDTFPLWYLQEVEGVRRDVRVVNLSLLNTHWYIRQLRDYEPRLNVGFADDDISLLRGYYNQDDEVVLVKDIMVQQLLRSNRNLPIYIAVTVPDVMDLEKHMVMEGLAYRIVPEEGEPERMDVEKTWHNLREVFRYRSLLTDEGYYDDTVYKDGNARKLTRNYVTAYVRLAHEHLQRKEDQRALQALEYARRIDPSFPNVLYTMGYLQLEREEFAQAAQTFRQLLNVGDRGPEVYRFLGAALEGLNNLSGAEQVYREALVTNPGDYDSHRILFTHLWSVGKRQEAIEVIQAWLTTHPDDELTRQALRELLQDNSLGSAAPAGSLP